jgi:hypothetical protein
VCTVFIPETRGFSLEELNEEQVPKHVNLAEQGTKQAVN